MSRNIVWTEPFKQIVAHSLALITAGQPLEDAVDQVVDRCYLGRAVKRAAARYQLRIAVRRALELSNEPIKNCSPILSHPLTAAERECLACPLAECLEGPDCPYHRHIRQERRAGRLRTTRWTWLHERVCAHFAIRLDPYVVELPQRDRHAATASVYCQDRLHAIRPGYLLQGRSTDLLDGTARVEFSLAPLRRVAP